MLNFNFSEKGLGLVSRKMFLMFYSINWPNFFVWLPLFFEIIDNMFTTTRLWRHKIWHYLDLSDQAVLLHDQKFKTKIQTSWERKELLRWNKKYFSSFLKGFQLTKNCLRPESAPLSISKIKWWVTYIQIYENSPRNAMVKLSRPRSSGVEIYMI